MSNHFIEQLNSYKEAVEKYLDTICASYTFEPQKELFDSMRYSLLAGGKRLRPIFVYDFCRMCGGKWENAHSFAAAVEMIHTYSLIHDDLPCMDNDDYRRGRLTNHKVYGEAMAILAGDGLLTSAFTQLAHAPFDPNIRIEAVRILSECAGEIGMVGGQALDMMSEERICTEQEVLDIQSRKTGALIRAACTLGVLAGGGDTAQMDAASKFALNLGFAFQIRDDMLDVIGDSQTLGKATGADESKNTFVRLYGLDKCEKLVDQYTDEAIRSLDSFKDNSFMTFLANQLVKRDT